jgi:predicted histidine transporter YuiF (NhaC family)
MIVHAFTFWLVITILIVLWALFGFSPSAIIVIVALAALLRFS